MKTGLELDTRSKLLEAAVAVFGKHGFSGSSVRQIADLANVNHGSIKYHYSSKNQLWRAMVAYLFQSMEAAVFQNEAEWARMTAREQLEDHIGSYIRFNAETPEYMRVIMYESISRSERFEWLADNYLRPFTDRAINRVALAQEQGVFRADIPPLNLYYMQISASRSLFFEADELSQQFGIDAFSEIEVQRHIDAVVALFVVPQKESIT